MATKTCPNCAAEIPAAASRCKHCFHEFEESEGRGGRGPLLLIGLVAAMVCVGAAVMYYVTNYQSVKRNVVIDEETESVVWTRTYHDKMETERLPFEEVEKIEVVMGGKEATWEVYVHTTDGERKLLNQSEDTSLLSYTEHVAHVLEKPWFETRNIKGFGEKYSID